MANHPTQSADYFVVIHLLDSAQGHSLQSWAFRNQQLITIGRSEESDVTLADPHVSRTHAKLVHDGDTWTLFSIGRHGTLIDDRVISEIAVRPPTVFRLGPSGPMMRLDTQVRETRRSETMDNIDADVFAMLEIDETRKQREVDQIAGNALFQELQEQLKRLKTADTIEPNKK
jgi:pSer/pThr/pTyr-binding forkhead associated (FHA) protein